MVKALINPGTCFPLRPWCPWRCNCSFQEKSWRREATNVRGGLAEDCGHWIPAERPEWALAQLLTFFGEEPA